MKKLVSILCSMALLLAVCVPAYADTTSTTISGGDLSGSSITVGNYTYYFSSATEDDIAAYLMDFVGHGPTVSGMLDKITIVRNGIRNAHDKNPSLAPADLWTLVKGNFSGEKTYFNIQTISVTNSAVTVTDSVHKVATAFPIASYKSSDNDKDSDSTSSPSTPTAPADSSQTTVTTGANGATAVGVTTAPDTAPTVSGGTASVVATVPAAAISTAAATATAEKPASVVISAPAAAMVGQMNSSAVQSVAVTMKVPSDVAYGTASNVNVAMNLDSSVLKAAGQTGKNVTVGVVDQMTGKEAYSWTFKGSDLAGAGSVGSVNMALRVSTSTLDSQISGKVPASDKGVVLAFGNNGTLPAPATVRVLVSNQGYQPGQQIHMYYYNSATNQVEALDNSTYTVDADGYVSVVIKHCSKYILSTGVLAAVQPVKLDTGKKLSVKAGKTYQFKVTASAKPAFTSGNNSVFKVSANGSKGSDYFFKVTAVGKVGQSTGFYVNGEKTPRTVGTIVS